MRYERALRNDRVNIKFIQRVSNLYIYKYNTSHVSEKKYLFRSKR